MQKLGSTHTIQESYGSAVTPNKGGAYVDAKHVATDLHFEKEYMSIRHHPLFNSDLTQQWDFLLPQYNEHIEKVEPLLKRPFKLFNQQVKLSLDDMGEIASQEMYKFLRMELAKEKEKNLALLNENKSREFLMDELTAENKIFRAENTRLEEELQRTRE